MECFYFMVLLLMLVCKGAEVFSVIYLNLAMFTVYWKSKRIEE